MLFLFTLLIVIIYPLLKSCVTDLLDESYKVSNYLCSTPLLSKGAVVRLLAKVGAVEGEKNGEELLQCSLKWLVQQMALGQFLPLTPLCSLLFLYFALFTLRWTWLEKLSDIIPNNSASISFCSRDQKV